MRIIAGERRGHKIDGPKGKNTRPTSDLVRESLFNILREVVVDRIVIDLFAGTGALGLEALSRGAARAIFVEQKRENIGLIHRNLSTLRYEDRASVLATDAYRWARAFRPVDDAAMVALLDPPYREYDFHSKMVKRMIGELAGKLPAGSVIAVECGRILNEEILPDFARWDVRRYGGTQIAVRTVGDPDGSFATDEEIMVIPDTYDDADGPSID